MTTVQIPVSLGGTNTPYNDGSGAYGMASQNGYGYVTYLLPMLTEVMAAINVTIQTANDSAALLPVMQQVAADADASQSAAAASAARSQNWAEQTGADVTGAAAGSRSSKSWAQDDLSANGANLGGSSKDWSISIYLPDGVNKSAKSNALDAQAAATSAIAASSSVAQKVAFTSTTTGLAGSSSGQTFGVQQSNGEGVDVYLNNAGAAAWQAAGSIGELALAELVARTQPAAIVPVCYMLAWQAALQDGRGALNAARPKSRVKGRNLHAYVHCPRSQTDQTAVTLGYGDSPSGVVGGTSRLLQTTTAQLFTLWTNANRPPAGNVVVEFQLKSPVNYTARSGNATQGYTNRALSAGIFSKFQHSFTTNGADWASFVITGDGVSLADLEIAEVRTYWGLTAAEIPTLAAEGIGDDGMPCLAWPKARFSGRLWDNTGASADGSGVLRIFGYPTKKFFSEATLIAAAEMVTEAANQQLLTTDFDSNLGTTNTTLAITSTAADGAPDFTGITSFFAYHAGGQGIRVYALTVKSGEWRAYVDGVEVGLASAAFAGFWARMFRYGSNGTGDSAYTSTFRWQGRIGALEVGDQFLASNGIATETKKIMASLSAAGIPMPAPLPTIVALGDSQTSDSNGGRGPSHAYVQANANTFPVNAFVRVLAVGGKTSQQIVTEQLPTALYMIAQAKIMGRRCPVLIFTGTNNQAEIVTDWNNGVSSFTSPTGWWQTVKKTLLQPIFDAGECVVWDTALPDTSTGIVANWEPARVALNAFVKTDMAGNSKFIVSDIGAAAGLSTTADTAAGINYQADRRHMTTAGQVIAGSLDTAALTVALDTAV